MKQTRQIKLQPRHRKMNLGEEQIVPCLILSGLWLKEHGFKSGETVTILVEENLLIIKPSE